MYVTAKTFPLRDDGAFKSEPAELAYLQAIALGSVMSRDSFRLVIQAYQCAQDKNDREYEAFLKERTK